MTRLPSDVVDMCVHPQLYRQRGLDWILVDNVAYMGEVEGTPYQ